MEPCEKGRRFTCPFAGTNRITFNGFTDGIGISGPPQDLPEVLPGVC
jgi:hypothetical protein